MRLCWAGVLTAVGLVAGAHVLRGQSATAEDERALPAVPLVVHRVQSG